MASTKRFVGDPNILVDSALRACVALQPGLCLDEASRVVYRRLDPDSRKVTLLSGGGSGHEPGHAGYVADGMLDAAVSGPIFASPNAKHVRAGLRHIASPEGSVVIIKNYTGDRLNFGLAAEQSRAYDGYEVETVVVQDDVAVPRSRSGLVGRRGLAGVVLVHKVAGAAAAEGASLNKVLTYARSVADGLATIGVSLDACSVPGTQEVRKVAPEEMELGMGIHNEPGTQKISSNQSTTLLVRTMLSAILDQHDQERGYLKWNQESQFVLLVNNLGGISKLELLSLTEHVLASLKAEYGIVPQRVFSGTYLSSLDGSGFSITLLALPQDAIGQRDADEILRLLDAPTSSVNWPVALPHEPQITGSERIDSPIQDTEVGRKSQIDRKVIPYNKSFLRKIIEGAYSSLEREEPEITRFDTHLGDGDCGTTLLAGIDGLRQTFSTQHATEGDKSDLIADMQRLTDSLGTTMGGTSGALYSIFFSGVVNGFQNTLKRKTQQEISLSLATEALLEGLVTMRKYTSAGVGDRTMMDALIPFIETLHRESGKDVIKALGEAVEAARAGCDSTSRQQSRYGRSTYVGAAEQQGENEADTMPDPGACGVVAIVQGIFDILKSSP